MTEKPLHERKIRELEKFIRVDNLPVTMEGTKEEVKLIHKDDLKAWAIDIVKEYLKENCIDDEQLLTIINCADSMPIDEHVVGLLIDRLELTEEDLKEEA
jgi:hypothetical protein